MSSAWRDPRVLHSSQAREHGLIRSSFTSFLLNLALSVPSRAPKYCLSRTIPSFLSRSFHYVQRSDHCFSLRHFQSYPLLHDDAKTPRHSPHLGPHHLFRNASLSAITRHAHRAYPARASNSTTDPPTKSLLRQTWIRPIPFRHFCTQRPGFCC